MDNKTISYYLKHNILKQYLIHVEFELENIIMKLKTDKMLKTLIESKGYLIKEIEYRIQLANNTIDDLIKIHGVD